MFQQTVISTAQEVHYCVRCQIRFGYPESDRLEHGICFKCKRSAMCNCVSRSVIE